MTYYFIEAPIAQLDRALVYGTSGWGFDSLWAHENLRQKKKDKRMLNFLSFFMFSLDFHTIIPVSE
jgi:amino acid permease